MRPDGKVVIITGASAGIGAATARAFVAAGASVVLAARDTAKLTQVVGGLPGRHLAIPTDVADQQAVEALVAQTVAAFGALDIAISNAGVGLAAPVARMAAGELRQALEVNLFGALALTQAALPHMRRRGGQLIYVSSVVGVRALPYLGGYAATKAALDRLVESLRVELYGSGVAVTLVRPGTTRTEFREHRLGHGHEVRRVRSPGVPPERVAQTIVRAAINEPRVAYVSWRDRLTVLASLLAPRLTDRLLARAFDWENNS